MGRNRKTILNQKTTDDTQNKPVDEVVDNEIENITILEETVPEDTNPEDIVPENTILEETVPEDTNPEDTESNDDEDFIVELIKPKKRTVADLNSSELKFYKRTGIIPQ